jgi:hypothetical protein
MLKGGIAGIKGPRYPALKSPPGRLSLPRGLEKGPEQTNPLTGEDKPGEIPGAKAEN